MMRLFLTRFVFVFSFYVYRDYNKQIHKCKQVVAQEHKELSTCTALLVELEPATA